MYLPAATASYLQRVRFGRYVARRLRRARKTALATAAEKATAAVKKAGRNWEDADDAIQDALADRDGADDDLDLTAQTARATLAGRSPDAARTAPYTHIFPDGLSFYTAATADQEKARYTLFGQRLGAHLPAKDEVLVKALSGLKTGLADHAKALDELTTARNAEALAGTQLSATTEAWAKQMEKIYGTLMSEDGKSAADRYFPAGASKAKSAAKTAKAAPESKTDDATEAKEPAKSSKSAK